MIKTVFLFKNISHWRTASGSLPSSAAGHLTNIYVRVKEKLAFFLREIRERVGVKIDSKSAL